MSSNSTEIKNSNIGKIITFGSLNLFLNLKLEKEDLKSNSFNLLQNLDDLSFITNNKKLWEKIELTSKNELLNTLFTMNKIKQNKNIISYIVLDKLNYNEEQSKFQELLDSVLLDNGLVICSYEVCKCKVSINLKLIYKKRKKKFVIYGEEDYDEEEEDNLNEDENEKQNPKEENKKEGEEEEKKENQEKNENKEQKDTRKKNDNDTYEKGQEEEEEDEENIDNNDIGLFEKIPEEVKFQEFKYLYFYYKDFISGGDLWGKFKLYQIYNFLLKLKNSNIKIIFNFGDDFSKNEKYLYKFMKLSDIHLFRDRTKILDILKKRKFKEEEIKEKETERIKNLLRTQKMPRKGDYNNSSTSNFRQKELLYSSREGFNSSMNTSFIKTLNKSQSSENIYFPKSFNLKFDKYKKSGSIDKNNIYNYLREIIYISNIKEKHPNYNDKLGIYLDEYKKIYIVKYKKSSFFPNITEYNLNIYPKPNIHNLGEINNINSLLMKDNNKYTIIAYGCILSCILDDIDNYFMYYYYSRVSILKILALKKNKMPLPKDKSFYIVQINKKELNKMLKEENIKQKENGFNNNHFQMKYKGNDSKYYPLMDKFLTSYMQCMVNIDTLKSKNLINDKKKILYDPEYKDIIKNEIYGAKADISNKKFAKFIMKENLSKNLDNKEKDYKKEFMSKKPEMKYHLPGINGIPEYVVYLSKEDRKRILKSRLPPIKITKKKINDKPKNEVKKKEEINEINENIFIYNPQNIEKKEEKLLEASNKNEVQQIEEDNKEKEEKINTDKNL